MIDAKRVRWTHHRSSLMGLLYALTLTTVVVRVAGVGWGDAMNLITAAIHVYSKMMPQHSTTDGNHATISSFFLLRLLGWLDKISYHHSYNSC